MKHHLAGTKKDVIPYCSVLDEVKAIFLKLLEDEGKKKEEMNLDCGEMLKAVGDYRKGLKPPYHEDIGELPVFYNTIGNAKKVTTYINRHTWVLNLYRKHSNGRELARPIVTRFATAYLTLNCIKQQKNALRSMFASEEWATSSHATKNEAKQVMNVVLSDGRFWRSITYCLKCVNPLVKVLRLVDGDAKLAMPYIYEAMDKAKEKIAENFQKQKTRYKKVWKIIDTRWNLPLHRPLYATAYYFNLRYHYEKKFNPHSEVMVGLYETFQRMVSDARTRVAIDQQLEKFKGAKGLFGMNMTIEI
ncbi:uncharacterized protein [Phaseolus vulgaris]|uniref:uncharacterized protein n=1 Tax=Phaseolus vulgaris TaxID=3885 RepID=UPI0035CB3C2A